jgi:hypothetical protein
MESKLRCVTFRPYLPGRGPAFQLVTWDTGRFMTCSYKYLLGYRLMQETGPGRGVVLFEGEDFGCPGHVTIDSDECVRSLMTFLCLRPGDTDAEYFAGYTEEQLAFAREHAEALALEVEAWFTERAHADGNCESDCRICEIGADIGLG